MTTTSELATTVAIKPAEPKAPVQPTEPVKPTKITATVPNKPVEPKKPVAPEKPSLLLRYHQIHHQQPQHLRLQKRVKTKRPTPKAGENQKFRSPNRPQ